METIIHWLTLAGIFVGGGITAQVSVKFAAFITKARAALSSVKADVSADLDSVATSAKADIDTAVTKVKAAAAKVAAKA